MVARRLVTSFYNITAPLMPTQGLALAGGPPQSPSCCLTEH